jgi:hypothetical protein
MIMNPTKIYCISATQTQMMLMDHVLLVKVYSVPHKRNFLAFGTKFLKQRSSTRVGILSIYGVNVGRR